MRTAGRRAFTAALARGIAWPVTAPLVVPGLLSWASPAQAKDSALPVPTSLSMAADAAGAKGEPLVLLVSLPGCPYCELVRRSYLLPARHESGLQAWQLDITDATRPLTAFDKRPTNAAAQIRSWKATFTPTVLFFGPRGEELAERLVGVAVPDFYGAYLDERLATARKALLKRP
ncbi:MAG: hypothetical protein EOO28_26125 [Comamonadaceae bacterium]|nr:MAG: hypothetical protein EOO28_26125 [Comamonadaceae bacterium]